MNPYAVRRNSLLSSNGKEDTHTHTHQNNVCEHKWWVSLGINQNVFMCVEMCSLNTEQQQNILIWNRVLIFSISLALPNKLIEYICSQELGCFYSRNKIDSEHIMSFLRCKNHEQNSHTRVRWKCKAKVITFTLCSYGFAREQEVGGLFLWWWRWFDFLWFLLRLKAFRVYKVCAHGLICLCLALFGAFFSSISRTRSLWETFLGAWILFVVYTNMQQKQRTHPIYRNHIKCES